MLVASWLIDSCACAVSLRNSGVIRLWSLSSDGVFVANSRFVFEWLMLKVSTCVSLFEGM